MLNTSCGSLDDSRAIKVLVVPIGENSLFDMHFNAISQLRDVSISSLSKPSAWNKETNNGFKHFEWHKGNLLFDYLRYDRVPNGPGDLDNFQCSRRVLVIMGLINYTEIASPDAAAKIQEELEYFTRRHPNVVLRRLFLFNYPFEGGNSDPYKELLLPTNNVDHTEMIVFPPDLICEGGNSMVNVHLSVNMENASCKLIQVFEKQMRICAEAWKVNKLPAKEHSIELNTFYDEIFEKTTRKDVEGSDKSIKSLAYKKRPAGRLLKWMGDLSMQACSPLDAIYLYESSITECRALDDHMWLAGALEGYASALLLLIRLGTSLQNALTGTFKDFALMDASLSERGEKDPSARAKIIALLVAEDRAAEAMSIYSTRVVFCALEVECSLRTAKMHEMAKMIALVDVQNKWLNSEKLVMFYVLRAVSVPGLNAQQQIECMIEGAFICKRMGLKRKYALLLYLSSLMSAENNNMKMAHALLQTTCENYGISMQIEVDGDGTMQEFNEANANESEMNVDKSASWISMRKQLFEQCASVAKESGDYKAATRFVAALLKLMISIVADNLVNLKQWAELLGPHSGWSDDLKASILQNSGKKSSASLKSDSESSVKSNQLNSNNSRDRDGSNASSATDISSLSNISNNRDRARFGSDSGGENFDNSTGRRNSSNSTATASSFFSPLLERYNAASKGDESSFTDAILAKVKAAHTFNNNDSTSQSEFDKILSKIFPNSSSFEKRTPSSTTVVRSLTLPNNLRPLGMSSDNSNNNTGNTQTAASVSDDHDEGENNTDFSFSDITDMQNYEIEIFESLSNGFVSELSKLVGGSIGWISKKQQENTLQVLQQLSEKLAPLYSVALPNVLQTLNPLLLAKEKRPMPLEVNTVSLAKKNFDKICAADNSSSSSNSETPAADSLFYNPFENKKTKKGEQAYWAVGCVCQVEAAFFNPLNIPLQFTEAKLLLKVSYAVAVLFPIECCIRQLALVFLYHNL